MIQRFWILARLVLRDQQGAAAIEYGLIAALIAVALFAGAQALGGSLDSLFNGIATFLAGVQPVGS